MAGPSITVPEPLAKQAPHGRTIRRRITKSPVVELVKIVLGGIGGLVIAYCLLLFIFQIDILDRLSSRKPAESRETARRPAEPQTKSAETKANNNTRKERAESAPTSAKPLEPGPIAVTPGNMRGSVRACGTSKARCENASCPAVSRARHQGC